MEKSVTLEINFGEDQCENVTEILTTLKNENHVIEFVETSANPEFSTFSVTFSTVYGAYLFGHMQASYKKISASL
jgi:hypothetical protein